MWNRIQQRLTLDMNSVARLSRPSFFRYVTGGILLVQPVAGTQEYSVSAQHLDLDNQIVRLHTAPNASEARLWADRQAEE